MSKYLNKRFIVNLFIILSIFGLDRFTKVYVISENEKNLSSEHKKELRKLKQAKCMDDFLDNAVSNKGDGLLKPKKKTKREEELDEAAVQKRKEDEWQPAAPRKPQKRMQMWHGKLLLVNPKDIIRFEEAPITAALTASIRLKNVSEGSVAYKIKTTQHTNHKIEKTSTTTKNINKQIMKSAIQNIEMSTTKTNSILSTIR